MVVFIDQSGKIEETQRDTIIAFSDSKTKAVRIQRRTKRKLQLLFRQIGKPRLFVLRVFCAAIFLLLKEDILKITSIVIDREYPGHEDLIRSILREFLKQSSVKQMPHIRFALLGKNHRVHIKAYSVFKKEKRENLILTLDELKKLAIPRETKMAD